MGTNTPTVLVPSAELRRNKYNIVIKGQAGRAYWAILNEKIQVNIS